MDEMKLHEFMGKLVSDMGGGAMVASIIVGEEVGFYRAMADGVPVTADELASRTGCNRRLTQEWLRADAKITNLVESDINHYWALGRPLLPNI